MLFRSLICMALPLKPSMQRSAPTQQPPSTILMLPPPFSLASTVFSSWSSSSCSSSLSLTGAILTGTLFNKIGGLPTCQTALTFGAICCCQGRHAGAQFVLLPVARLLRANWAEAKNDHHRHAVPAFFHVHR